MSAAVIDLAETAFRSMVGKRCTIVIDNGRKITGKVLPGIGRSEGSRPRFRIRARETWYITLDSALRLKQAPKSKRWAA